MESSRKLAPLAILIFGALREGQPAASRATEAEVYKTLFPRVNPSLTARLGIAAESTEIDRILGDPWQPARPAEEQGRG